MQANHAESSQHNRMSANTARLCVVTLRDNETQQISATHTGSDTHGDQRRFTDFCFFKNAMLYKEGKNTQRNINSSMLERIDQEMNQGLIQARRLYFCVVLRVSLLLRGKRA